MSTQYLNGMTTQQAQQVLANITQISHANPTTYTHPINHSGTAENAGTYDNITVSGVVGQPESYVSTPLRTQVYKLTLEL